jgi:hypothetical protein
MHLPAICRGPATVAFAGLVLLSACGGSGGGSGGTDPNRTGSLTLSITDAPVDAVSEVWIRFTGVRVKPREGQALSFPFATPKDVDLLQLTGENSMTLLNGEPVPVGQYDWIALDIQARFDGEYDSYVVTDAGHMIELQVPSGDQQGLRLVSGFTITADRNTHFMIDWDLRKGLTNPVGRPGYFLRPALRITDMSQYGTLSGTVADALVMETEGPGACNNDLANDLGNLVYIFAGSNQTPVDISGADGDPLTTARVASDPEAAGAYTWSAPFMPVGNYTVAFTCQGLAENPEQLDGLVFSSVGNATVAQGQTTVVELE